MDLESLKPIYRSSKGNHRLIFRYENKHTALKKPKTDIILQFNHYLAQTGFPSFTRVIDANYTKLKAISALLD
jgi:hypothetical protein